MVTVTVKLQQGWGDVYVYQNGIYLGDVSDLTGQKDFNFNPFDNLQLVFWPLDGFSYIKVCETNISTNCYTTSPFTTNLALGLNTVYNVYFNGLGTITINPNLTVATGGTVPLSINCADVAGIHMTCPLLQWYTDNDTIARVDDVTKKDVLGIGPGTTNVGLYDPATGIYSNNCAIIVTGGTSGGSVCGTGRYRGCSSANVCECITGTGSDQNCVIGNSCGSIGISFNCSGAPNYQCNVVSGTGGTYANQVDCLKGCKTSGGGSGGGGGSGILGSITIDKTVSAQIGKTVNLTVACTDTSGTTMTCPNLVWKSSNEGIATVSSGTVTGVSVGTTNITATDGTTAISSNAGVATVVTVGTGFSFADWLQAENCFGSQKNLCAKNWMLGAAGVVALILLTRR